MSSNALLRAPVITPLPWPLPGAVADKIAAIGVPASLVRSLQTLHYHVAGGPDEDPRYLAAIIGEEARDGAAFLPQGVPKILLSAGPSFETRRAAAAAGIEAVVRWPAGLPVCRLFSTGSMSSRRGCEPGVPVSF